MSNLKAGRPSRKEKILSSVREEQEDIVRMNINLKREFYKLIKQKALDEETTVTEVVKKALYKYMSI